MRRYALIACVLASASCAFAQLPDSLPEAEFARLISELSEQSGYFDTDNLITNEDAYLHPVSTLRRLGVSGGAYIGVGPDQNFSYMAATRPSVAFIVDIRRDNMLQHLLFKAVFTLARNRVEYLCILVGCSAPADTTGWSSRSVDELLAYADSAPRDTQAIAVMRTRVIARVRSSGVELTESDLATIGRFHGTFLTQGLSLRFNTTGRAPQWYYPDLRGLLRQTDRSGAPASYMASEEGFRFVRGMHERNLIIPVTGDFGGSKALRKVGEWLSVRRVPVRMFYTSNVEQYLLGSGAFGRFVQNVDALPRDDRSVMVRSYFQGGHPQNVSGYYVTMVTQYIDRFVELYRNATAYNYRTLVTADVIPPG